MLQLLKSIFKTTSSTAVIIIAGIINTKIIAVVLGTTGIGLYSLLKQIMQTTSTIGAMGGQTPLIQGIASKEGEAKKNYIKTTFWLFLVSSVLTIFTILLLAPWITEFVLDKNDNTTINLVRWIALPSVLMIISIYLTSIINGFHAIGRLALIQIISPLASLCIIFPVVKLVGSGYTLAFIWLFSISLLAMNIVALWFIIKNGWLKAVFFDFQFHIDKHSLEHFYKIASITLIIGLISSLALLLMRAIIVQGWSLREAGIFDVAWTLSMAYGMILINSFMTFYMPALSKTNDAELRNTLIKQMLRIVVIIMTPILICIIALKPFVIEILYSADFIQALELVKWMLIADYIKLTRFILYIPVIAYADMKTYLITEIFWYIGILLITVIAVLGFHNLEWFGIGFLVLNLIFLIIFWIYTKVKYNLIISNHIMLTWLSGLILIITASFLTWKEIYIHSGISITLIIIGLIFPLLMLRKYEYTKIINMLLKAKNKF